MYIIFFISGLAVGAAIVGLITYRKINHLCRNANYDELSGLLNYSSFQRIVKQLDPNTSYSLILIDLDGFKTINDEQGYTAGDQKLKAFADFLQQNTRTSDKVFRYKQGDEFAFLVQSSSSGAQSLIQRLLDDPLLPLSFSYGITQINPQSYTQSVQQAELALREMKKQTKANR